MIEFEKVRLSRAESNSYFVKQSYTYTGDDYWNWSVWIESKDRDKLDKISSVTYHLHNTFLDPVRVVTNRKTKFKLESSGWGEFRIYIVIKLKGNTVIELTHDLKLEYPTSKQQVGSKAVAS